MSRNYELLQTLGKGQGLFPAAPRQSPVPTEDLAAPAESTSRVPLSRWPAPADATTEPRRAYPPGRVSVLFRRSKAALQLSSRDQMDLDTIAREEEIKLVQRLFLSGTPAPRAVVFSGIDKGNGCSRTCADVAVMLAAQTARSVCLVDADLRSPALHDFFGLKNGKGFAEAMLQFGDMRQYCHQIADGNLWIMTSGSRTSEPRALLAAETLGPRMKELRKTFDFVLIDVPPFSGNSGSADAMRLGPLADGIVLVIGANATRREAAQKAKADLTAANCNLLAAVLNRRTFPVPAAIYREL